MIADGQTGRLFRSRDQESLAAAMRELREDPDERARLGEAARRAVEEYRPQTIARRLEDALERVLDARGRATSS